MISVILLFFTVILIIIGVVCGFRRGILKEGVRVLLWLGLFACSIAFVPQIADKLPLLIAERFDLNAVDVEQLVSVLLNKVDILKRETYLILPMAGFIRTLITPLVLIILFWLSGLASWLLYLIAVLIMRRMEEPKLVSKLSGLVLGLVIALVSGAVTVYPVASTSNAISKGDSNQALCKEFNIVNTVANAYEGSAVKVIYKFTGTEFLGTALHNAVNFMVVTEASHNIWNELLQLVNLASGGWQSYAVVTGSSEGTLQEYTGQLLDTYFSLDFVTEENKVLLLKRMKSTVGASLDASTQTLLDGLELQSKEQITNDIAVYARVYDILRQEGILEAVLNGADMPELSEETGDAVVNALFGLSNADTVVPGFINMIYTSVMSGSEKQLVQTEALVWNEESKAEISEVVSVICKVSAVMEKGSSMSLDEKKMVLEAVKTLKENDAVGKENYSALLKVMMGML